MLYDYRTLNKAFAASEGPIATFGDAINLSEDLSPLFVADDIDYDNFAVSSPDGENVYAVWAAANRTIFFRASHDGGSTFDPAIGLNNELACSGCPPEMVSSGNHIFVTWLGAGGNNLFFRASHDNGVTFGPIIDFGSAVWTQGNANTRQLAVSGSNVYLAWMESNPSTIPSTGGRFLFAASHDNGVTFGPITTLMTLESFLSQQELLKVVASDNRVYAVLSTFLRISDDNGVTFGPIIDFGLPLIDLIPSGSNAYILFLHSNLFFTASHDGGDTFDPPINLGSHFERSEQDVPQMAVATAPLSSGSSNTEDIYVVWHSINRTDDSESLLFRASHDGGSTFGAANTLASGSSHNEVRIAVAGTNVYVTYRSFVSGIKILFTMSSDSGSTFGPVIEVVNPDVYLNVPKLAAISSTNADSGKADSIFVAWQEVNRGGPVGDLFFRPAKFIPLQFNLDLFEGSDPSDLILSLGQEAKAVAATNDPIVTHVNFIWNGPSDSQSSELVPLVLGSANSTFTPDEVGTWVVIADFGNGEVIQQTLHVDFLVIPESPIGMVALMVSSFLALGGFVFWKRKSRPL